MNQEQNLSEVMAPAIAIEPPVPAPSPKGLQPESIITPQCGCGCGGNGGGNMGYVYAISNLYPAFPNKSLEEEYMYAYQEFKAEGPPNSLFFQVLSQGQNLYIAEQMCWVLNIDGVDAYIVKPRSHVELYHFIAGLEPIFLGE